MPFFNYTLQDVIGIIFGVLLFPLILIPPGYIAGWVLDLFDFKSRRTIVRFLIALILSIAISPILFFWSLRFFNQTFTYILIFILLASFVVIFYNTTKLSILANDNTENVPKTYIKSAFLIAILWVFFVIVTLAEIQVGDKLYFNVVAHDFSTRVAIINAITRTGVPPINPGFYPGHPVHLTYLYYFWYILCSLVDQLGSNWVDAREAMTASVVWCGLALMATVALYMRIRNPRGSKRTWKLSFMAIGLIFVSGLDIIPILLFFSGKEISHLEGDIEHWNEQITAWVGSLSWVPHHVAAMIACLTAVMLLLHTKKETKPTVAAMVLAGLAFASAFGLSVFVTIVFAIFWGIWWIITFRRKDIKTALLMILAGVISLAAIYPFIADIITNSNPGTSTFPLTIAIRKFIPLALYINELPGTLQNFFYFLALPLNYFLELGFFFLSSIFWYKVNKSKWAQNPFFTVEVIILTVSFFVGSFVRSTVIFSNDIGWRAWLPGQFITMLWGADILEKFLTKDFHQDEALSTSSKKTFNYFRIFLILGVLTTLLDVTLLRTWPLFVDSGFAIVPNSFSPDTQLGKRTFAARQVYEFINQNTSQDAIIQYNPTDQVNRTIGLYLVRQVAVSTHTAFGISTDELNIQLAKAANIFKQSDWHSIDLACKNNLINFLVINDQDYIWRYISELAQTREPIYSNEYYAVFRCGQ